MSFCCKIVADLYKVILIIIIFFNIVSNISRSFLYFNIYWTEASNLGLLDCPYIIWYFL